MILGREGLDLGVDRAQSRENFYYNGPLTYPAPTFTSDVRLKYLIPMDKNMLHGDSLQMRSAVKA